jgi:myo-inositol 2-dehydrogenase/D-chiro-inositol 1-dehydrogenase
MARYLVGSEVQAVFATGGVLIDPAIGAAGDVDTALVVLWFENGAIGTIDNSRQAVFGYDQRAEVLGSAGMATCTNNFPDSVTVSTKDSVRSSLPLPGFIEVYRDAFREEMRAFLHSVETATPPPITGHDARIPLVMGLAATRSLREGRIVKLSEIG